MATERWEYCELEFVTGAQHGDFYSVRYSSPDQEEKVDLGIERDEFSDKWEANHYLGSDGWEAFHIDGNGTWYFKRAIKR